MGEAGNFLGFIITTLHSLPPVPSPESLSSFLSFSIIIHRTLLELARGPSADLKGFREFPEELSVNYSIDVCVMTRILQFRVLYSYNNGTV